ncbi:MAG: cell division protein ZapE [Pseudomonadota bacterium]
MSDSLKQKYHEKLADEGWQVDKEQTQAIEHLENLLNQLKSQKPKSFWPFVKKRKTPKGIYMYGGVGRGKSMVMDLFFDFVPLTISKQRIHFHEFMIKTHDWLHQKRGERVDDLMPRYARHVAKKIKLLCFDEFHVTDVADAMILGRLFTALFEEGVVVVATSNRAPDDLYEGGLQRDRFLPFIELLKAKMIVDHLDSETDYRQIAEQSQNMVYFSPLTNVHKEKIDQLFQTMIRESDVGIDAFNVKGRTIQLKASENGIARSSFSQLCEEALGAEDYIAIADRYHTLFLENIPYLSTDKRNEAKRFILLIDCLYEARCRLILSAEKPYDEIYEGSDHAFEFDRTMSRLMEMQSREYQAKATKENTQSA